MKIFKPLFRWPLKENPHIALPNFSNKTITDTTLTLPSLIGGAISNPNSTSCVSRPNTPTTSVYASSSLDLVHWEWQWSRLEVSHPFVSQIGARNIQLLHEDLESVIMRSDDESINSIMAEWESAFEDWLDKEMEVTIAWTHKKVNEVSSQEAEFGIDQAHDRLKRDVRDSGVRNCRRYDDVDRQGPNNEAVVLWKLNSLENIGPEKVADQILTSFSKL
ncbi:hypothetical protein VNO78_12249 [Psophocarpus tetragonolobus]|uniref:Uncharacterized protein n=1 Tax=Psophocarpus tetragonolobus TaxID=3891 RepID=A0AAN9SMN2_PSOTE